MIAFRLLIALIIVVIIINIYVGLVYIGTIVLMELNFYIYKRRCNKYMNLAMQGEFYKEEFFKWFEVEEKMHKIRIKKINKFHDILLLKERKK